MLYFFIRHSPRDIKMDYSSLEIFPWMIGFWFILQFLFALYVAIIPIFFQKRNLLIEDDQILFFKGKELELALSAMEIRDIQLIKHRIELHIVITKTNDEVIIFQLCEMLCSIGFYSKHHQ